MIPIDELLFFRGELLKTSQNHQPSSQLLLANRCHAPIAPSPGAAAGHGGRATAAAHAGPSKPAGAERRVTRGARARRRARGSGRFAMKNLVDLVGAVGI